MAVSASHRPQLTLGLSSGRLAVAKLLIWDADSASSRRQLSRNALNTSATPSAPGFLLFLGCEQALLVLGVGLTTNESSAPSSSSSSSRAVLVAWEISA
jgi:hypothetical protein